MLKKEHFIKLAIILFIFFIGFSLRVDSSHLHGIPSDEKAFYEDQNGLPYMYDMDSYYNYRMTQDYLDHGYLGDAVINGTDWDLHSYYPPGVPIDYPPLIAYITSFIYKLLSIFTPVSLLSVSFWIPAFIAPLCGIPAYFIVSRLTNDYGGIAAGVLAVTSPLYFVRSVPGWFDTDMFNVLFPLLIILFFFEAFKSNNIKTRTIFACLSSISMFIFALAWDGWQYLFYIISIFCIFYVLWRILKKKDIKKIVYISGIFILGSISLIFVFTGILNIVSLISGIFELIKIAGNQGVWAPWPNAYIFITELQPPSLKDAINGIGFVLSGLTILGIFIIFKVLKDEKLKKRFLNEMNWFFYSFLIIWTVIGICSLKEGIRFILLLVPPLVILAGITMGIIKEYFNYLDKKQLNKLLSLSVLIVIVSLSVLPAYNTSAGLVPRMNDDLWDTAVWINNNTSNDTVVISSWVYCHFFSAVADRPVVFDGRLGYIETLPVRNYENTRILSNKSPSVAREYWIDRAFSTSNENLSLGIFRMLATSGDLSWLTLERYTQNMSKSVEILNEILPVDRKTAEIILIDNYSLSQSHADNVLKYTHPNNSKPFVVITYSKMIDGGYWIFNFGEWNFEMDKSPNYFYSFGKIKEYPDILKTDDGIVMNLKTRWVKWNNNTPYCVIIIENGKIKKSYLNKTNNFCVVLNIDDKKSVILDKRFENSTFTKLILEKSNNYNLKSIYKMNDVNVWKFKSR